MATTFGVDLSEYTADLPDVVTDAATDALKYPFRYDTKPLYTFCYPDLVSSGGALTATAIDSFKEIFEDYIMDR